MEPAFEKLLALLADSGVRFIVVGGVAVTLNGYVRLTEDVGILLEASPPNIGSFLDTMSAFGEGFARELSLEDFSDEEGAIRIVEESEQCQVDAFTRMSGLHFPDLLQDAEPTDSPAAARRLYSSIMAAVAVAPQREPPRSRTLMRPSRSRTPPAAFTCTLGETLARMRARSCSVAPL